MTTDKAMADRKRVLDAALKASFDAKAAEATPDYLVDLAHRLAAAAPSPGGQD